MLKASKVEVNKKVAALIAGKEISCKQKAMASILIPAAPNSNELIALPFPRIVDSFSFLQETHTNKSFSIALGYGASINSIKLAIAIVNLFDNPTEKDRIIELLFNNPNVKLGFLPEETKKVVEVTQELFDAGLQFCIDNWMVEDEFGCCTVTPLNVGDYLVITPAGYYGICRDDFIRTHSLN